MNIGVENNMKIADLYCLNPNGCPLWKGKTSYEERKDLCSSCAKQLNKVDLVDIYRYINTPADTNTSSSSVPTSPKTGKGTQLSKKQIKEVLEMYYIEGLKRKQIATQLHFSYSTVKKVVELAFTNETSNQKVREVMIELGIDTVKELN